MLVPDERHAHEYAAALLEGAVDFCKEFVGIEDVFKHLSEYDAVKGFVCKRELLSVVEHIYLLDLPILRRVVVHADIFGCVREKLLIGLGAAADIQNFAGDVAAQLLHILVQGAAHEIEWVEDHAEELRVVFLRLNFLEKFRHASVGLSRLMSGSY